MPLGEAAVEVFAGLELVVAVGEEGGAVAGVGEQFGDGVLLLGDGSPARGAGEVALVVAVADVRKGALAGVEGAAEREGGQGLGEGAGAADGLGGKGVEVRGADPVVAVGAEVVFAEGVEDDEDDVHGVASGRRLAANAGVVLRVRQPEAVRGRWEGTRGVGGEGGNGRAPARPFEGSGWRATVLGDFFGGGQAI